MTQIQTAIRTELAINGRSFFLERGQDIELRQDIESAVRAGAAFVDFTLVGGGTVSVLITSASRVTLIIEAVEVEPDEAVEGSIADVTPLDFG